MSMSKSVNRREALRSEIVKRRQIVESELLTIHKLSISLNNDDDDDDKNKT